MYGMCGKLIAQPGQRDQLAGILARAARVVGGLPGCRLYLVCEDLGDENAVWVFESWEDKASHDASLQDEQVRPLMGGPPEGSELRVVGGYGLDG